MRIRAARQERPFGDLTDFARRVDLRQVGKRALEALVKVGALDAFGPRRAILDVLILNGLSSLKGAGPEPF